MARSKSLLLIPTKSLCMNKKSLSDTFFSSIHYEKGSVNLHGIFNLKY